MEMPDGPAGWRVNLTLGLVVFAERRRLAPTVERHRDRVRFPDDEEDID